MMKDITRIDIRKVTPYGKYIDLDRTLLFDLTDEEILALRRYHNKPDIAYERVIIKKQRVQSNKQNTKKNYKFSRNQKYNNGRHRTKRRIKRGYGKAIIVGGVLVFTLLGANILNVSDKGARALDDIEIYGPTYSDSSNTLDGLTREAIDSFDYDKMIEQESLIQAEEDAVEESYEEEISEREMLIQNICNIYQLDYNIVYQNLVNLTNNFTSEDYLSGRIAGVTCKGVSVEASTEEELLIYAIRCMKQLPGQMGLSSEGLYCRNGYDSGTNYYEQLNRVANVLGVDRCLLYAVVNAECSFDSDLFNNLNNPAGLKGSDGSWWRFDTKEEGFFELGMELLKYYRKIGMSPDNIDSETLSKIRDIHAPLSDGNEHWLPNVLDGLEYAKMHEAEMFGSLEYNNGLSL